MDIAFFTGVFPKISETFIINQVTGLIDRGHEVTVFTNEMPDASKEHDVIDEYDLRDRTVVAPSPSSLVEGAVSTVRMVAGLTRRFPGATPLVVKAATTGSAAPTVLSNLYAFLDHDGTFDICHAHFGHVGKRWAFVSRMRDQGPFVTTFYGWDVSKHPHPDNYHVYESFWPDCDLCLGITEHVLSRCMLLGADESNCIKHPIGVPMSDFEYRLASPGDGPLEVVTVARHVEKKGLKYAIDAIAECVERGVDINYRIAGDGPLREELERRIADREVGESVSLLGWQTRSEVQSLLKEAHVFALPSVTATDGDMEGQALVLQEAQATGVPVVATYHDGIPEGVAHRETGLLVPERDETALADAFEAFADDGSLVKTYGKRAREFVAERFANEELVARQEEIYEGVQTGRLP